MDFDPLAFVETVVMAAAAGLTLGAVLVLLLGSFR